MSDEIRTESIEEMLIKFLKQKKDEGDVYMDLYPDTDKTTAIPTANETDSLEKLREAIGNCTRCTELANNRTNLVFGVGNPHAELVFVGEAPGEEEDKQGIPFVGRAGQLLTKIINAMGFDRNDVYIMNVLKCRPPNNRDPLPDEVANCNDFFLRQLKLLKPKVIVALGKHAAQTLLKTDIPISKLRGTLYDYHGIPLMPTFHPSFLLRNPSGKREVWQDMQEVMKLLKEIKEKK
mgnify:FL=1